MRISTTRKGISFPQYQELLDKQLAQARDEYGTMGIYLERIGVLKGARQVCRGRYCRGSSFM